jgi:hypothetical protein
MAGLTRIDNVGEAAIFKGDPRLKEQDIDKWYQGMLRSVGKTQRRAHLYGADAGLCARRNVLLEHNTWVPSETSSATNAYYAIGIALEDMLCKGLENANQLIASNPYLVEIPGLKIRGKIDLVIVDHQEELALVEVKSCGKLPTEPRPTHLVQAQTYAAVSGIHKVWLTYISRHVNPQGEKWGPNVAMRSFLVDTGTEVLKERLRVALVSVAASRLRQLPPVPAHFRKHTECHYCEFRDLFCWKPRPGLQSSRVRSTGLGEDTPFSPIEELDTDEYITIDQGAKHEAESLIESSPQRKLATLKELYIHQEPGTMAYDFLRKEIKSLRKELGLKVSS